MAGLEALARVTLEHPHQGLFVMPFRRRSLPLVLAAACLPGQGIARRTALEVQSHDDFAPFQTGPAEGLTHDLVAWLHERLPAGETDVRLSVLPRRRLDLLMRAPSWRGLVPWAVPDWFADADMTRFVWSAPLLQDADLVLFRKGLALDYQGPNSLRGLRLGGVLGHRYVEVKPLIDQGLVQREDAPDTSRNLHKLLLGRVDVVFLAQSGLAWWQLQVPDLADHVHVAPTARARYARRMLLSPHLPPERRRALLSLLAQLDKDPAWQRCLARYGLHEGSRRPGAPQ